MKEFNEYYIELIQNSISDYLKNQFEEYKIFNIYDKNGKTLFSGQQFLVSNGELYKCRFDCKEKQYIATKMVGESYSIIMKFIYPDGAKINYIEAQREYVTNEEDRYKLRCLIDLGFEKITNIECNTNVCEEYNAIITVVDKKEHKAEVGVSICFINNVINYRSTVDSLEYWYNLQKPVKIIKEDAV